MIVAFHCLMLTSRLALASQPESDPSTWTPPPIVQVPEDAIPRAAPRGDRPASIRAPDQLKRSTALIVRPRSPSSTAS